MDQARLKEFETRLRELQARVEQDFDGLRASIQEEQGHASEPSHAPTHAADVNTEGLDVDLIAGQTESEILAATEDALVRIERGTYGVCEECGKPISDQRLQAVPYADRCIHCA
ncbi:MAG: TraR/DksA family transcriptional regulator [Planctomycetota bacterium]|jgi:RNA polymerase-binding protein DksA